VLLLSAGGKVFGSKYFDSYQSWILWTLTRLNKLDFEQVFAILDNYASFLDWFLRKNKVIWSLNISYLCDKAEHYNFEPT
jgi:hypothetical protein